MKNILLAIIFSLLFSNSIFPQSVLGDSPIEEGWRELTPVRSTQREVESKLGFIKEIEVNHFRYENSDLLISFVYSAEPCSGKGLNMNLPKGTLLDMMVAPKKTLFTSELNWHRDKYTRQSHKKNENLATYVNREDSIHVVVTKREKTPEQVIGIYYLPSRKYDYLKCK